ncbi:MAG: sarcosine oxidase subunit delta [Hyphomicrobiaceae bacterium]|nr:sarcosine oxidase subunit delta [Hyphomicrobiaceae bacterium]
MRIHCPHCGTRDHTEFSYGGDATVTRPPLEDGDIDRWHAAVFLRPNPKGIHREYWHHALGCRSWLIVERDTLTHRISATRLAGSDEGAGS